ncbi:MAG TPA: outer membrane protein assembly factor BamE [Agitococcus sp.]|nr:outer membrane protein assembly factor BamE [Agitococcus sp.]HNN27640.1 outer membrane protein assembly factor BamE [Agitococcus sp.]
MSAKLYLIALVPSLILLPACSTLNNFKNSLTVYKIDLPQGNPITQDMANKLKIGMTPSQVRYVLGSPMVTDTFNANRWDYVYRFTAGTYAKAAGINSVTTPHLSLRFDNGKLSEIKGMDTLPTEAPANILSKDGGLRAEPLN